MPANFLGTLPSREQELERLLREFVIHAEGQDVICEFCGAQWSSLDQLFPHSHGCIVNQAKLVLGDE